MSHRTLDTGRVDVRYISDKTARDYRVCARALEKFFGRLRLSEIDEGHLRAYQQQRHANPIDTVNGSWHARRGGAVLGDFETLEEAERWAREHGGSCEFRQTVWAYAAGANCIRKEIALLERILVDAGAWTAARAKKFLKVQAVEPEGERALSREEQHRLLHVAPGAARHRFMYQYVLVALQTTAGPNELRHLRLGDIYLNERAPYIEIPRAGAKNRYRRRTIPLITDDAVWAMEGLVARARELGAWSPAHYLFPLQASRTHYDAERPMSESGLKKPWQALRRQAQLPRARIYDLRHTGITRMAEEGVPLMVAMSFAGHMTEAMQRHYVAISMASQREWGRAVWGAGMGTMREAADAAVRAGAARRPVIAERVGRQKTFG